MSCMGLGHLKPRSQAQESLLDDRTKSKDNQSVSSCKMQRQMGSCSIFGIWGLWCFLAQQLHRLMVWSLPFPIGVASNCCARYHLFRRSIWNQSCRAAVVPKNYTSSFQASRAGKFQAENNRLSQRKILLIEYMHGHQPMRCPSRVVCAHQPSAVPSGGGLFCGGWLCLRGVLVEVMWCGMMSCGWLRREMK